MITEHTEYKIRHVESGLYSCGGTRMRWADKGKTWTNLGHLKNHLRQHARATDGGYNHCKRADPDRRPRGCELVCLRVSVNTAPGCSSITIVEMDSATCPTLEDLYNTLNATDRARRAQSANHEVIAAREALARATRALQIAESKVLP